MHFRRRNKPAKPRRFDVGVAGWVLSLLTFLAGTVVPVLYSRLAFDGISIRQPNNIFVANSEVQGVPGVNVRRMRVSIGTVIKVANARKDSILIEDIGAPPMETKGWRFEFLDASLWTPKAESFDFPAKNQLPNPQSGFPMLIKGETTELMGLELHYRAIPLTTDTKDARASEATVLQALEGGSGLAAQFRIDGKLRTYQLRAGYSRETFKDDVPPVSDREQLTQRLESEIAVLRHQLEEEKAAASAAGAPSRAGSR